MTEVYDIARLNKEYRQGKTLLVIEGNVVDVTEYRDEHPGGGAILEELHGLDATTRFKDQFHSEYAEDQMSQLIVGQLSKGTKLRDPEAEAKYSGNKKRQEAMEKLRNQKKEKQWRWVFSG